MFHQNSGPPGGHHIPRGPHARSRCHPHDSASRGQHPRMLLACRRQRSLATASRRPCHHQAPDQPYCAWPILRGDSPCGQARHEHPARPVDRGACGRVVPGDPQCTSGPARWGQPSAAHGLRFTLLQTIEARERGQERASPHGVAAGARGLRTAPASTQNMNIGARQVDPAPGVGELLCACTSATGHACPAKLRCPRETLPVATARAGCTTTVTTCFARERCGAGVNSQASPRPDSSSKGSSAPQPATPLQCRSLTAAAAPSPRDAVALAYSVALWPKTSTPCTDSH